MSDKRAINDNVVLNILFHIVVKNIINFKNKKLYYIKYF